MSLLFAPPYMTVLDLNGNPVSGAKLYFYQTGTTTPVSIYSDAALATPLSNPVIADSAGRHAPVYLDSVVTYRCKITDAAENTIKDVDPATSTVSTQYVSAGDYSTVALAVASGKDVWFPAGVWTFDQVTVTTPGQKFYGEGAASILRSNDAAKDLFVVRVAGVGFFDLRMEGAATSAGTSAFAIKTDAANPAPRLHVERVTFSGDGATKGFTNAIKLDSGADYSVVRNCQIERLWGNSSGYGYGVLLGAVTSAIISENSGTGTAGRGRHFCYVSSGASKCKVVGNHVVGFDYEAITLYATDAQPTCDGNIIAFNTLVNSVTSGAITSGAIHIAQNVQNTTVIGNYISASGGQGIFADGTGSTKLKNNSIRDNTVVDSGFRGVDAIAFQGGEIIGNTVRESSVAVSGTYPNLRLASDGVTASSNILVSGNHCGGTTNARSSFQLNSTAPVPSNIKVYGNKFDVCNWADVELYGVTCAIDGRIRAQTTWATGSIADGASVTKTGISVPGAISGDIVSVTHETMPAGWLLSGVVTGADTVAVTAFNKTGGASSPTGNLYIDVWQRTP